MTNICTIKVSDLKEFSEICEAEGINEYIRDKKRYVKRIIAEIINGKDDSADIELPETIELPKSTEFTGAYEQLKAILKFFFLQENINNLCGFGITFVLNFLSIVNGKYHDTSIKQINDTISLETIKLYTKETGESSRKASIAYLKKFGLEEALKKYDIK